MSGTAHMPAIGGIWRDLVRFYDENATAPGEADAGTIAPFNLREQTVKARVTITPDGEVAGVERLEGEDARGIRRDRVAVPIVSRSSNVVAAFAADKQEYVCGDGTRRRLFYEKARDVLAQGALSDSADALLAFARKNAEGALSQRSDALLEEGLAPGEYAVFRLEGEDVDVHRDPDVMQAWDAWCEQEFGPAGIDAVTGEVARLALSVDTIMGTSSLFGMNAGNLRSYGARVNADYKKDEPRDPTAFGGASIRKAMRALDFMASNQPNRLWVDSGDYVVVYGTLGGRKDAVRDVLACDYVYRPEQIAGDDEDELARLKEFAAALAAGEPLPGVDEGAEWFAVGLQRDAQCYSIAYYDRGPFEDLAGRVRAYHAACAIGGCRDMTFGAAVEACRLPGEKKASYLYRKLHRAVADGRGIPRELAARAVRKYAVPDKAGARKTVSLLDRCAMVCKGYLVMKGEHMEPLLNREDPHVGYQLGRAVALGVRIQELAANAGRDSDDSWVRLNASLRDKYFKSAVDNPAKTMPAICENVAYHASKVNGRLLGEFDEAVSLAGRAGTLPDYLDDDEKARFVVGYHQQRLAFFAKPGGADGGQEEAGE